MSRGGHNNDNSSNLASWGALARPPSNPDMQRLSDKQVEIMRVIRAGNGHDPSGRFDPVDLDELLERVNYKPSKDSMHFSIRALIRRGLIEKGPRAQRRGRSRGTLLPTAKGWTYGTFAAPEHFVEVPPPDITDAARGVEDAIDGLNSLLD